MRIDCSAAELFLSYLDGAVPLADVWDHPAYAIARDHADLLGKDLSRADVTASGTTERTTFPDLEDTGGNRERITQLLARVRANEAAWTGRIERHLERVTPDEDTSDVTLHLAIGYEFGIGLQSGAYVNVNEPLFLGMPRQLLYAALHECSHVLYDREHGFSAELDARSLDSREEQRAFFDTLFHTEAYATYTPLELRRSDGNVGGLEHVICEDYRVVADETRLRRHVEAYDSFRETLRSGPVSRETLLARAFGGARLPYRVGCALLDRIEEKRGIDEVRDAFYLDPDSFVEAYDWILDDYRGTS